MAPRPERSPALSAAPLVLASVAAVVSGLALVGWATENRALKAGIPGGVPMNPATALAAVLTALSLVLRTVPRRAPARGAGRGCAGAAALAGLAVLARYLFGWDAGLDTLLFEDALAGNRMAPNTAAVVLLLGAALVLGESARYADVALALAALSVCGLGLIGYTFGAHELYGLSNSVPMAVNSAVVFAALALGTVLARPDRGPAALVSSAGAGGALVRRLLPAAVAVPWGLGWVRLQGERAGLFDAELGVALMVVATIALLLVQVGITAGSFDRTDARRRRAEAEALRTSEEVRDLYDNAPCGYHSVGPDGTIVAINRTELRWLGYEAAEVVGRVRFADLVSPTSRATYERGFARVRAEGAIADVELDLVRKDGTAFPVLVASTSVRDAAGGYLRSRTTLTDLTERRRAEAAVRLFADVARNIPIGLVTYQFDGPGDGATLRFRSANPEASRLLAVPLDEAVGRPVLEVFPAIPPDEFRRYAGVAAAGAADDFGELRYGDARIAERWWAVHAFPLPDRAVGVAFRDVSDRKRAEAAVRLFATVAEEVPIGLLIFQLDGEVLRVRSGNREATRLLNISFDEVAGRAFGDVFPKTPAARVHRYAEVAASGAPDDLGELPYGDERWCSVHAFPLPERSVGVAFQDITDRKRAEGEVRRLNAELEGRVRERTAELETANRDLAQKNAENEMFVYSVSHDLRSPLVNLQGFSKELEKGGAALAAVLDDAAVPTEVRDRARAVLGGKMTKSIGFIQTAVTRLTGIIEAMLRLSRAGRVEYRREAVDVAGVVARVVGAAQGTVAERGAAVRVGDLPPAWGDRTAIEQVLGNLVGNALAYLDPTRPGLIEIGCLPAAPAGGFRTYFVKDNGLGIAEGQKERIFQAFHRAHPGVGSGEGLGLAIVARVVERHRGRVWVESGPGVGSTFFVTLPETGEAR